MGLPGYDDFDDAGPDDAGQVDDADAPPPLEPLVQPASDPAPTQRVTFAQPEPEQEAPSPAGQNDDQNDDIVAKLRDDGLTEDQIEGFLHLDEDRRHDLLEKRKELMQLQERFGLVLPGGSATSLEGRAQSDLQIFPTASGMMTSRNAVVETIRRLADLTGEPIEDEDGWQLYSGHSLRVSGAQWLGREGARCSGGRRHAQWLDLLLLLDLQQR